MSEKNTIVTCLCPNCGNRLDVDSNKESIICACCDSSFLVKNLINESTQHYDSELTGEQLVKSLLSQASVVTEPEGGLIYLENFFENYDWNAYQLSTLVFIKEITEMVNKNKLKAPKNPQSYLLEFESIYTPLTKKIEGLKVLEKLIINNYDPKDSTNAYVWYDVYSVICRKLDEQKTKILKNLETTIVYSNKLGLEEADINSMNNRLEELKNIFEEVKVYDDMENIPSLAEHLKELDNAVEQEYLEQGIDAKDVYTLAVSAFEEGKKNTALLLFQSINKYKDSLKYIKKINLTVRFKNLVVFGDYKFYRYLKEPMLFTVSTPDPTKKKGCSPFGKKEQGASQPQDNFGKNTFEYYEIIDKKPSEKSFLSGVTYELCTYGSNLFFIEKEKRICCYDFDNKQKIVIDESNYGYANFFKEKLCFRSSDGLKLLFKKKLPISISNPKSGGCLSIFKKPEPVQDLSNNYEIIAIDLKNRVKEILIPQVVDVMDYYNDEIFFQKADKVEKQMKKKIITTMELNFYAYNLKEKETAKILDVNCEIYNVTDEKIIFGRYNKNHFNISLYTLDLHTKEEILLEENIYDYRETIDNRIYYTVGSAERQSLFAIELDGTGRTEIMQNAQSIALVRGGWMYIAKKYYSTTVLVKVSVDGKKKVLLCDDLMKVVKFTNDSVYYINNKNDLHVVRSDGNLDRIIAENINPNKLIVENDCIYFLKNEKMGLVDNVVYYSSSIYKLDINGHNLIKLFFNVKDMTELDENNILVYFKDDIRYKFIAPISEKESEITFDTRSVDKYIIYNKQSGNKDSCLFVGIPNPGAVTLKGGCLKKPQTKEVIFEEVIIPAQNIRKGVAEPGQVAEEVISNQKINNGVTNQQSSGCSSQNGCKNGCAPTS